MAINLKKGHTIDLKKEEHDLSQITIGLGWKIVKKGFLQNLMGKAKEHDLDAIAFLLDENGKILKFGNERLEGGDVVFFNNLRHFSGAVSHSGDNRVGGTGAKDDEQIVVRLDTMPPAYHRILFLVQIYQGIKNNQDFSQVSDAYIRAVDAKGKEIARYDLESDATAEQKRIMIFAEVYRRNNSWKFRALGEGHATDSFAEILKSHL